MLVGLSAALLETEREVELGSPTSQIELTEASQRCCLWQGSGVASKGNQHHSEKFPSGATESVRVGYSGRLKNCPRSDLSHLLDWA